MEIIDSHCHLDVAAFDPDREAVLAECRARGVSRIVVPAITAAGWARLLQLCRDHAGLYPALGLHPCFTQAHRDADLERLAQCLADAPEVVAVGEIGLDFYIDTPDRARQIDLFEAQLAIAAAADLPVIVHVRKAHNEVLSSLKRIRPARGGIIHAYNGSLEQAREYIDLGFKLGFGGMITYEGARKLRRLAAALPLASIVLETDAPDMSGAVCHGGRNSPACLPDYLAVLARLRDAPPAALARATSANVIEVLRLGEINK